jgi:hypothetical protein
MDLPDGLCARSQCHTDSELANVMLGEVSDMGSA